MSYNSNKEPARITTLPIGSQSYFELIRNKPEVAKYLALGKVLFNYQGTWYLAADDNDVFKYKGILYRMIKGAWQKQ